MTISSAMTVAAVQPAQTLPRSTGETAGKPASGPAGPATAANRPVATEMQPSQPIALPPVVTALTADFAAGRAAAEAARDAYHEQRRISAAG